MSNITAVSRPNAAVQTPTDPAIYNVPIPSANTEVAQALSPNTRKIMLRCRGTAKTQYAFVVTESGTKWITIPRGGQEVIDDINFTGTIYLQTSEGSQVIELLEWT